MFQNFKAFLKGQIARSDWFQEQLRTEMESHFEPYVVRLELGEIHGRFFIGTPQAKDWYDPIKPYARLEYEWVLQNIPLKDQRILDVGAHHGHYTVVFNLGAARSSQVIAVDPYPMNCQLAEVNLLLNNCPVHIVQCAASDKNGMVRFSNESNGRIIPHGGMQVEARSLDALLPEADIVKLDVEGEEYVILPQAIDKLRNVHTWIVEIHPYDKPHPDQIMNLFLERSYDALYLDRDEARVQPFRVNMDWKTHTTIFARKR